MNKFALLLMMSAGSVAYASSTVIITFTALPVDTGSGTNPAGTTVYVGETAATVAGIAAEDLICDDFNQSTIVPSGPLDYSVNTISTLTATDVDFNGSTTQTAANGLLNGVFATVSGSTPTQTQAYDTVAVLATQVAAINPSGNSQQIADYNYAIWFLMEPAGTDGGIKDYALDANATTYLQNAFAAVKATTPTAQTLADEASLVIYTPTSANASNQEFVGLSTPTGTPEPSSWIPMAGLGLLLCVPRMRTRLRSLV